MTTLKKDKRFPHLCPGTQVCAVCQRLREEEARLAYYALEKARRDG